MTTEQVPVVSGRAPCPCGSGRRFKACHGKAAARALHARVVRPFEGLADEPDWVAMRELVPAGTAQIVLAGPHSGRDVTLGTVLPLALPALVRQDGRILLAAQTQTSSGDLSRDLADALTQALDADPGTSVRPRPLPPEGPRLQDLVDVAAPLRVVVHSSFEFWVDHADDVDDATRASLDRAGSAVSPTARLAGVRAAYWMVLGDRVQLRWVLPEGEEALVDAFARLHAAGRLDLGAGTRYLGSFRALGLLVPVWDLAEGTDVDDVEEPAAAFRARLDEALATGSPLSGAERRARQALSARQLTIT
jgi:Family of unknown function (DUF5926)/SEC-C motif